MKLIKLLLILLLSIFLVECSTCKSSKYRRSGKRYVETNGTIDSIKGKHKFKAIYLNNIKICNYTGDKTKGDYISVCYYMDKYQNEFDKEI